MRWRARSRLLPAPWRIIPLGLGVSAFVAWLVVGAASGPRLNYQVGDVVRAEIVAPSSFSVTDEEATERRRLEAEERVVPVFSFSPSRNADAVGALERSIARLRAGYEVEAKASGGEVDAAEFAAAHIDDFPLGDKPALEILARRRFEPALVEQLLARLRARTTGYIIGDDVPAAPQVTIRNVETGQTYPLLFRDAVRLSQARDGLQADVAQVGGLDAAERKQLGATLAALISTTATPDAPATAAARRAARAAVPEVTEEYRTGEMLAYRNQTVDARIARVLEELARMRTAPNLVARWVGVMLFVGVLLFALWQLSARTVRAHVSQYQVFVLASTLLVLQVALIRLGVEIAERLGVLTNATAAADAQYLYAIPFAVAPLVTALLLDGTLGLVSALMLVPLVSLMTAGRYGGGTAIAIYSAIGSTVVVWGTSRYHSRVVVFLAGLLLIATNVAAVVATTLLAASSTAAPDLKPANVGVAAIGALLTAALAALVLPAAEWAFGILSDVRLLELASADQRLLRELAIRAPGTHQHSYVMSSVATEAAKAIGANPMLARVGAYYHDVGKLHAPEMFVENQQGGPNPHDALDPVESARVILRHVSYGVELAHEEGLPPQIRGMITGHHGTRRLHFFYEKARRLAAEGEEVDDAPFRYPGPKPQSREAAILMLADGCEAAVRSLDEPTREAVEQIVHRVQDAVLAEDQLDECGITLEEVNRVREAIVETLLNIHHRRVKYPGFNQPEPAPAKP